MGATVAYISAWLLWGFARIPLEVAIIGPRFTFIRYVATFAFPPIAGLIAHGLAERP